MRYQRRLGLIGLIAVNQICFAAAFQFYELGAPINGTAAVGQAVIHADASIAYYNPAGMSFLPGSNYLLGVQMILPYVNFTQSNRNTIRGNNGGNAGSLVPGGDFFLSYQYSPKISLGLSLTAPYGGSLNYEDHWSGRFYVQQLLLYALNLNPTVSYRVNNCFSIGAGIAVEYENLFQNNALPLTRTVDGQVTIKTDDTNVGYNLGVMFLPTPSTTLGVAYRSQIVHNLHGKLSFFNLGVAPQVHTKLVSPANVIASVAQQVTPRMNLLGELGWANWSVMRDLPLVVDGFSVSIAQKWRNTYRVGVGAQYHNEKLMLQTGVSYDSSPTQAAKRTPNLPMDKQIRVGTGLVYALTPSSQVSTSYEYINMGRAAIQKHFILGTLAGHYKRNFANVLQLGINVNF